MISPTLSASWYLNDNFAVELWGAADKFNHRVNSDTGAKLGTVDQQPLALSAQYHFGRADSTFRPFVGVGYYESNFSNEDIPALDGLHVGVETAKGAIGTVGVDMNINPTWFVRADARYLHARPELTVGGQGSGSDLTPEGVAFLVAFQRYEEQVLAYSNAQFAAMREAGTLLFQPEKPGV